LQRFLRNLANLYPRGNACRLPEDLGDLVPRYLSRLPRPRLIWLGPYNEYRILSGGDGENLLLINEGHPEPDSVVLDDKVCE